MSSPSPEDFLIRRLQRQLAFFERQVAQLGHQESTIVSLIESQSNEADFALSRLPKHSGYAVIEQERAHHVNRIAALEAEKRTATQAFGKERRQLEKEIERLKGELESLAEGA